MSLKNSGAQTTSAFLKGDALDAHVLEDNVSDCDSSLENHEDSHRAIFIVGESRKNSASSLNAGNGSSLTLSDPQSEQQDKVSLVAEIQCDIANLGPLDDNDRKNGAGRSMEALLALLRNDPADALKQMTDFELVGLIRSRALKQQDLEKKLGDERRAVVVRRLWLNDQPECRERVQPLPFEQYDYSMVSGACCENVIGYVPIPVGYAGPLILNGRRAYVPMATTEGALVASTNRGCRAIEKGGGVRAKVFNDGMSRAPIVEFPSAMEALELKEWLETSSNFQIVKQKFDSTSGYARLQEIKCTPAGRQLFLRFVAKTGDAMGMNMLTKGTDQVMQMLMKNFINMEVISVSGNYCVDKKASGLNWIEGRGKSVLAEAVIPAIMVEEVLKTSVDKMVDLGQKKLQIGSSMAATVGGNNAQAANVVAAIFLATGQDAGQIGTSSMCMTQMEKTATQDLYISCTMPCMEIGTRGGGTILPAQRTCLEMLGCAGGHATMPGKNAHILAETICATVLAAELSLLAAQCTGDLVGSHMKLNRSRVNLMSAASEPVVGLNDRDRLSVPAVGSRARRNPGDAVNDFFKAPGCSSFL